MNADANANAERGMMGLAIYGEVAFRVGATSAGTGGAYEPEARTETATAGGAAGAAVDRIS